MVYEWTDGYEGLDPQEVGEALRRLADRQGGAATSVDIVNEARTNRAKIWQQIRSRFTWDDAEAAELYRHGEARRMVRSLVVVEKRPDGDVRRPAYYHVNYTATNGESHTVKGYQPVEDVILIPDASQSAALYLKSQLEGLERRFRHIADPEIFEAVWLALEEVRERFEDADEEAEAA